jgi:nucleoside-diphosphate-sugar epimerase
LKILLIGGTGIISTPMTSYLLDKGYDLTLYNRGQTDARYSRSVKTIQGNREDYRTFETQMREAEQFDCVIDMIGYKPSDIESVVRAFKGRIGHYIFCSTVDVYKKPATRYPYLEDEDFGGLNTYSSNKVVCEQLLTEAHERGDFPVTVIRPAYTYSEPRAMLCPGMSGFVYFERLRSGKPIIVHGDGSSLWGSCYASDVAGAFVGAVGNPATYGKSYHTTGKEWLTWNQYHAVVADAIGGPPPQLVHIPTDVLVQIDPHRYSIIRENFQFNNIFDNRAAHDDLGFRYTVPLAAGVRRVVAWLEENGRLNQAEDQGNLDQIITAWESLKSQMSKEFVAQTARK